MSSFSAANLIRLASCTHPRRLCYAQKPSPQTAAFGPCYQPRIPGEVWRSSIRTFRCHSRAMRRMPVGIGNALMRVSVSSQVILELLIAMDDVVDDEIRHFHEALKQCSLVRHLPSQIAQLVDTLDQLRVIKTMTL